MYDLVNAVWVWLKSWPVPVWSTIGGSAMTLMGVYFSDRRNTRRLIMQNEFSATQAEITRVMGIRKDVYLTAAGALAKMQAYLVSIPEQAADTNTTPLLDFSEVIGKISMVGNTDTALLAQRLAGDVSEAQTLLGTLATTVRTARASAKDYESYRKKAQEQIDRVAVEINKFLEAGTIDDAKFKAMQDSRSRYQDEVQTIWAKEIDALHEVSAMTNAFLGRGLDLLGPISETSIALLVAIRAELGQQTDAAKLVAAAREQRERTMAQLRDLIASVNAERDAVQAEREASRAYPSNF